MATSVDSEKGSLHDRDASTSVKHEAGQLAADKSAGVRRIEQITAASYGVPTQVAVYASIFLISYAYGLDGLTRSTYQAYATSSYSHHSLLSTVNVLRSVIAAVSQPTYAKLMDVFGRTEILITSVLFYLLGTIIEASANGVEAFAAGAIFYQLGYSGILVFVVILTSDISSLRNRSFLLNISSWPFLINTWISGDVTAAVLKPGSYMWRWGIGMWAIIYFACSLPLIITLFWASRKAKKAGVLEDYKTPFQRLGFRKFMVQLFWQIDAIGLVLVIACFSLILAPMTIAGGVNKTWGTAHVIAPLVVGVLCVPVFVWWERRAKHPLVPFALLKDRGVWAPIGIETLSLTAWYLQGDFLYTVLVVAFNESITSATRITSLFSFVSVLGGTLITGVAIRFVRRTKPFVIAGIALEFIAFGLLIYYRGGSGGDSHAGVIAAQVILGLAGGFYTFPNEVSIQAQTTHENLAVVTGVYYASYDVGGALGNTISGAIWTQLLPQKLTEHLGNATLALEVFGEPLTTAPLYPWGSPERNGIVSAYREVQRLLTITGICILVPMLLLTYFIRNPLLGDEQSLPASERGTSTGEEKEKEKSKAAA